MARRAGRVYLAGVLFAILAVSPLLSPVPILTAAIAVAGWRAANVPAVLPPSIPVFLSQGSADIIVSPSVTWDYMQRLCRSGSRVRMLLLPGEGHGMVAVHCSVVAVDWLTDRFDGNVPPDDCANDVPTQARP